MSESDYVWIFESIIGMKDMKISDWYERGRFLLVKTFLREKLEAQIPLSFASVASNQRYATDADY